MLEMTRKQIEGYVMAHRVPYRNDSSNFESDYKRNRIRNEVFPIFEKLNPSFVKTLNREIGYFAEAGSIVEDWCRAQMPNVVSYPESSPCHPERSEGSVSISIPSLLSTKNCRYLLYYILEPYGFNSATLESLEDLLESDRTVSGKRFESATHLLYTERDSLVVKPILKEEISVSFIEVPGEGIYELNGVRWQVRVVDSTPDFNLKQPVGTLVMDADKMAFPFVCRAWKQGDWLVPFGLKGRKKVSDLFADLKFTQIEKARALMMVRYDEDLAENQHIAGVLGYRIDDRYKVDSTTKNIVLITILNNTDTI
jgi:tRNA(Ile)-lysidine synthase